MCHYSSWSPDESLGEYREKAETAFGGRFFFFTEFVI